MLACLLFPPERRERVRVQERHGRRAAGDALQRLHPAATGAGHACHEPTARRKDEDEEEEEEEKEREDAVLARHLVQQMIAHVDAIIDEKEAELLQP
ncbi:hypothetical protein PINS_up014187 [Pythium insidiosum]|nr:hypothetical protein PINS_up014187 [Pythium insidiosum]